MASEQIGVPAQDTSIAAHRLSLSARHWLQLHHWQGQLNAADQWHAELPVLLLDRCWLRLKSVSVGQLVIQLPPDTSAEAPELVRYRQWLEAGQSSWEAQLHCWQEFGSPACHQALQRHWQQLEQGTRGWTMDVYLQLLRDYRRQMEETGDRKLPLIVLGRPDSDEPHRLVWLHGYRQSIGHTCA